ncbi:vgr related protein [Qipengyuania sediminis]|uniref:vgr related protein n=1 Tax=Qipengyuania sediminis TaxID=1532023 RepID=UPI001F111B40|nr:vgr related protein [Qipengyuania sediminis]
MTVSLGVADGAPPPCPVGGERALTAGEVALARSIFGDAIDYTRVTVKRRKWAFFQPRETTMAPRGHLHFHPQASAYCDDFAGAGLLRQGLLIHELTHVWQTQSRGSWYLVLNRHPWCRYDYSLKPGWRLEQYGIEQQAEIVKHAFWLRNGLKMAGASDPRPYDLLVKFPGTDRRPA